MAREWSPSATFGHRMVPPLVRRGVRRRQPTPLGGPGGQPMRSVLAKQCVKSQQAVRRADGPAGTPGARALCDRDEAFLPLRSEELTSDWPRRIYQFTRLVDDIVALTVENGQCSIKGLRAASGAGWSGRYARIHGIEVFFHIDVRKWHLLQLTPLWVTLTEKYLRDWPAVRQQLAKLEHDIPPRLTGDSFGGHPVIPLRLPVGEEREVVLDALLAQVKEIWELLAPLADDPTVASAAIDMTEDDDVGRPRFDG